MSDCLFHRFHVSTGLSQHGVYFKNMKITTLSSALLGVVQIMATDRREVGRAKVRVRRVGHLPWAQNLWVVGRAKKLRNQDK